jgi:hypothetical protein
MPLRINKLRWGILFALCIDAVRRAEGPSGPGASPEVSAVPGDQSREIGGAHGSILASRKSRPRVRHEDGRSISKTRVTTA